RSAVPHPAASAVDRRRAAGPQAARAGRTGARIQLRFPALETRLRTEEALARAHEAHLSALPHPLPQGQTGPDEPAQLLVRALPETLRAGDAASRRYPAAAAITATAATDEGAIILHRRHPSEPS